MKKRCICLLLIAVLLFSIYSISSSATYNTVVAEQATHEKKEYDNSSNYYSVISHNIPENTIKYFLIDEQPYYCCSSFPFGYIISDDSSVLYETMNIFCDLTVSNDVIWLLENRPENGNDHFVVIRIPLSGEPSEEFDLVASEKSISLFSGLGKVFVILQNKTIDVYQEDFTYEKNIVLPDGYISYDGCMLGDECYLICKSQDRNDVYRLNEELSFAFTTQRGSLSIDSDRNCFLLLSDTAAQTVDQNGNTTPFIVWDECGINVSGINSLQALGNGCYLLHDYNGFRVLKPVDRSEVKEKTLLTIASLDPAYGLQQIVSAFNAANEKYFIKIVDYSDHGIFDKVTAQLRMNTEFISGNSTDMISVSSISPYTFMKKGMLKDISELILSDDEFSFEDISISEALKINDGIFFIAGDFILETRSALNSFFGDRYGWTLEEYLNLESLLPSDVMTIYNMTTELFYTYILPRYVQKVIDWSHSSCWLNSEPFIELLKLSKQMRQTPEDINDPIYGSGAYLLATGKILTAMMGVNNVWQLAMEEQKAGDKLSFIGWPTVDGSCGSDVYLYAPVGVLNSSENQDGCWEFIKFLLTHPVTELPVYLPALRMKIQECLADVSVSAFFNDEKANEFLTLVSKIDNVKIYDETLMNIIRNECNAFFFGSRTAEETADIIQSKVSVYLAEQP